MKKASYTEVPIGGSPFILHLRPRQFEDIKKWAYSGSGNFMPPIKKVLNGHAVIEFDMIG